MRLRRDDETFKCYMMDTGLLLAHAFDEKAIQGEELYQKLLLDKLEINSGMLIENIVDEFECAAREGEELDYEDIEDAAECLINNIPYAGIGKSETS